MKHLDPNKELTVEEFTEYHNKAVERFNRDWEEKNRKQDLVQEYIGLWEYYTEEEYPEEVYLILSSFNRLIYQYRCIRRTSRQIWRLEKEEMKWCIMFSWYIEEVVQPLVEILREANKDDDYEDYYVSNEIWEYTRVLQIELGYIEQLYQYL